MLRNSMMLMLVWSSYPCVLPLHHVVQFLHKNTNSKCPMPYHLCLLKITSNDLIISCNIATDSQQSNPNLDLQPYLTHLASEGTTPWSCLLRTSLDRSCSPSALSSCPGYRLRTRGLILLSFHHSAALNS